MSGIQVSGLLANSAFDWKSIVDQLIAAEGAPITKLNTEKTANTDKATAITAVNTALGELQDSLQSIRADDIFSSRTVSSDLPNTTWKCSSVKGTAAGSYSFEVTQLATQAKLQGAANLGNGLRNSQNGDAIPGLELSALPFTTPVTDGTFTINGAPVTVALDDTLETVLAAISTATSGAVTGSYDYATDKITLSGVTSMGDIGDTSNFIDAMDLEDSGGGTYASGAAIGPANYVADLTLASLPTAAAITAGMFTVDGKQVTVALTDSLQDVFDAISTATSGAVKASYDHATDRVTLRKGTGELVLGAGNDTSNFLATLKLANSGGTTSTSSAKLGSVTTTAKLADARLRGAVTSGSFEVNGVSITYDVNTDTVASVISKINTADAGVTAAFDKANDRVFLTNQDTGDVGISVSEVAGGLVAALGLSAAAGGTLVHGKNALVKINGGDVLSSTSNTLEASTHGITGLSVTVNTETEQILQVESDTIAMQTALEGFIEKFNAVQDLIEENTKVTVSGVKVSTALLSGNREVESWADRLRALAFDSVEDVTGDISMLNHLGIDFDGTTSHLKIKDSAKLATALGDNPDEVQSLFLAPSTGLVSRIYSFITDTTADGRKQIDGFTGDNTDIDEQIATLQARLDQQRETLTASFIRMLDAQSTAQSQNTYLTNQFFKNNSNN